jgi:hypothetical protein
MPVGMRGEPVLDLGQFWRAQVAALQEQIVRHLGRR